MFTFKQKPRPPISQEERDYRKRVSENKKKAYNRLRSEREKAARSERRARVEAERNEARLYWAKVDEAARQERLAAGLNGGSNKRYWAEVRATPAWADPKAMLLFYAHARLERYMTGIEHHVDHIVPINSEAVCGLHCEHNLQVIVANENMRDYILEIPCHKG